MSLSGSVDWLGQYASIKVAPLILNMRGGLPFLVHALLLTSFLIWGFILIPETKGYILEDVDRLFLSWKRWKYHPPPFTVDEDIEDIED